MLLCRKSLYPFPCPPLPCFSDCAEFGLCLMYRIDTASPWSFARATLHLRRTGTGRAPGARPVSNGGDIQRKKWFLTERSVSEWQELILWCRRSVGGRRWMLAFLAREGGGGGGTGGETGGKWWRYTWYSRGVFGGALCGWNGRNRSIGAMVGPPEMQHGQANTFWPVVGLTGRGWCFEGPFVFGKAPSKHPAEWRDCPSRPRPPPKLGLGLRLDLGLG